MFSTNVFWTFISKSLSAIISFIIITIGAQELKAEVMGEVSQLILFVTITQIVSGLFGGTALIYMAPRNHLLSLLIPAYLFTLVSSAAGVAGLYFYTSLDTGQSAGLFLLATLISFSNINLYLLLGKEKIRWHNFLTAFQSLAQLGIMSYLIFIAGQRDVMAYLWGYGLAFLVTWLISLFLLPLDISSFRFALIPMAAADTVMYGFMVQISTLLQFLNYRYSYGVMLTNLKALGVYTVATQMAEGVWIISRSMSMVQLARISNSQDPSAHLRQTLFLMRLSGAGTLAALLLFFVCPQQVFVWLFGEEFFMARDLVLLLSPGILFVAITSIMSSYFSGTGKIWINTIGSFIGLVVAVCTTAPLVQRFHLHGAAISNTLVYASAFLFSLIALIVLGKLRLADFLPGRDDLEKLRLLRQRFLRKQ